MNIGERTHLRVNKNQDGQYVFIESCEKVSEFGKKATIICDRNLEQKVPIKNRIEMRKEPISTIVDNGDIIVYFYEEQEKNNGDSFRFIIYKEIILYQILGFYTVENREFALLEIIAKIHSEFLKTPAQIDEIGFLQEAKIKIEKVRNLYVDE